ncbi:mucin-5AC-like [Paramacrobiotus metropolitanus]|uniref:mucin-5AC-like n=1 Tax=Paramacrobiotus metropolitanus TaxID=2943436 RepID=UPI002445A63F|nr:mucin-5AC-like [Paramacrobiotus metropolitanus]
MYLCVPATLSQLVAPLGRYTWLDRNSLPSVLPTTQVSVIHDQVQEPALSRKNADNGSPADVAFEMSCAGLTSAAALHCPCAGIGQRCADQTSICNADHKCVCDSALGYQDAAGKHCIRYPTTTPFTYPTCPVCPACPTVTCPTCPTTTTATCPTTATTTTTTMTTTTKPTTTTTAPAFPACSAAGATYDGINTVACGDCFFITDVKTITIMADGSGVSVCTFLLIGSPGSTLQINPVTVTLLSCAVTTLIIEKVAYCIGTTGFTNSISVAASSMSIALYSNFAPASVTFQVSVIPPTG